MKYRNGMIAALLAPLVTLGAGALSSAHASGYGVFAQGASALGQGNAVTAHTESPNTVFYNPALMNKLEGTQLEIGTTAVFVSRDFDSTVPGFSSSKDATFFPSTFYATYKFNDKLSAGLGVFSPFGLGTEWNSNWSGRYLATKSELTTFDINPVVSYRILPSLSIAAGLDVILVDATLERKVATGPTSEFGLKFKGDGTGFGYNVALAYDVTKDITFGASYRSSVFVDIDGSSSTSPTFAFPTPPLGALFAPFDSNGKTSVRLPQQVTAGIAYQVTAPLVVEAGMRWEGWSAFKELQLTLDNNTPLPATPRNWRDTFGFNLGGKYQVNDTLALSAGYVYGNNPIPDSTFDPSIPDADTHIFCLGSIVDYQNFKISLSYAYQMYVDRTKKDNQSNPHAVDGSLLPDPLNANGNYSSHLNMVALSVGYKF